MQIIKALWRYWKWVCVALCTTTIILFLIASILTYFNVSDVSKPSARTCIESGGTWNADTAACERAG